MSRTGRPRNLRLRLAILERLPRESVGEILRSGSFTRPQLAHYLRELTRAGYVVPLPYFSHLDFDGPGAKRYGLTGKGRHLRQRLRERIPPQPPVSETPRLPVPLGGPASVDTRPAQRPPRVSVQSYVGVHNLCFVMTIEAGFRRPFHWEKSYPMGNRSWMKHHSPFGKGIHLEESGGLVTDPPGTAGHTLSVKFKVAGPDAEENEAKAERVVGVVRRTLEVEYGCTLSDPVLRSQPKHSVVGDPYARALRGTGVAIHGDVGVDDTPEGGTLEFRSAERLERYERGMETLGTLGEKVDRLLAEMAETNRALGAVVDANSQQLGVLRELLERIPKAPVASQVQPPKPPDGQGYG